MCCVYEKFNDCTKKRCMKILVTGANGYIGGRLVPLLLKEGHRVSVLVRNIDHVKAFKWFDELDEVILGDVLLTNNDNHWVDKVIKAHFDVAYYLIHSIYAGEHFEEMDKQGALNFCRAAKDIKHIIYLGGILPKTSQPSRHLKSRAKTGEILRQFLPVTEFRAGTIIGSGSASFEMIRYLTERLPIMVTPKWVTNLIQPIGIEDVLKYLVAALDKSPLGIVDIGGEALPFKEMMLAYAKLQNLKRFIIVVPVLTPTLAARWVGLVTPIPNVLAIPLIEGIKYPVLGNTEMAKREFPLIEPISYMESLKAALIETDKRVVETHWANSENYSDLYTITNKEGIIEEVQRKVIRTNPEKIFKVICDLGGKGGWLRWRWAWQLRGFVDQLIGGPGLSRGKRSTQILRTGDSFDFFRIEKIVKDKELLLHAEMKIPGEAWLRFEIEPHPKGVALRQTAYFKPHGLWGIVYWYSLYPIHYFMFKSLINAIEKKCLKDEES